MQLPTKKDLQRDDLRTRLIDAAERRIAVQGLAGLKAREVTGDAGCALGALYNAFDDLDELILHVSSRTLRRLGVALAASQTETDPPDAAMAALARAYVTFALENRNLWSALFKHWLPDGRDVPDWHLADHAALIDRIIGPLAALRPDLGADMLRLRARTLFAAVHGVVQLALEGRFVGAPPERIASEVEALVRAMTRGLADAG
jgi:AcrR family transcriptional regulator